MNTLTVNAPSIPLGPVTRRPRTWLAQAGTAFWRALQASGQARAHFELLAFADRCEATQPGLAKEMRAAARHTLLG
jgi:hypothetical protein